MKKYILFIIAIMFFIININVVSAESDMGIKYSSHIQCIGWQDYVPDGELSGTVNKGLRIEAYKIDINRKDVSGEIEYTSYVEKTGWQEYVSSGNMSGTTLVGKQIEAIKIRLTGELSEKYDVYYRVHVRAYGWLGWSKNDAAAGTIGKDLRIEAMEIKVIPKGTEAPGNTSNSYIEEPLKLMYSSHVQCIGWQDYVPDGELSGTVNKGLRIEAYKIDINRKDVSGEIEYTSYVEKTGWQDYVSSSNMSGTTLVGKQIEAIKVRLTGELAEKYDVYYRVHVRAYGWLGWSKNDAAAGTIGKDLRIEAMEIKIVSKGSEAPGNTSNSYIEEPLKLMYSSHVQCTGWQDYVSDGGLSGTTGLGRRIEALKINVNQKNIKGSIMYSSHVRGIGWQNYVSDGGLSGTVNKGLRIEAVKIKLTGELEEKYDIYYRTHIQNYGWLDWAFNGSPAGSTEAGLQVEAIEIKLVPKGSASPGNTNISYGAARWETESDGNKYYYDIFGNKVTGAQVIGGETLYFGPTGIYLGNNNLKIIDVSTHQGKIDWDKVASSGIYGVILRIGSWNKEDSTFKYNISEVKRLGIPYGIYMFSYASTINGVNTEASFTNSIISKYDLMPTLGIYYDIEDWYISSDNTSNNLGKDDYDNIVRTYISNVYNYVNGRYKVKVYANLNYANNRFNDYARSQVDWIAQYNSSCAYTGNYSMWQYTSSATLPGINGYVDMSIMYK